VSIYFKNIYLGTTPIYSEGTSLRKKYVLNLGFNREPRAIFNTVTRTVGLILPMSVYQCDPFQMPLENPLPHLFLPSSSLLGPSAYPGAKFSPVPIGFSFSRQLLAPHRVCMAGQASRKHCLGKAEYSTISACRNTLSTFGVTNCTSRITSAGCERLESKYILILDTRRSARNPREYFF
jgi:hypothetical protein